jgi:protein dpy-30
MASSGPTATGNILASTTDNGEQDAARMPGLHPNAGQVPVRQYLDQTIVPVLVQGLAVLAKERPADPYEFMATFILRNRPADSNGGSTPS